MRSIALFSLAAAVLASDEVLSLPGWTGALPSKQYSGFLDIDGGKHHHYWHVESENSPDTDPLVFWFNGGPGCSSLEGLFVEQGPLLIAENLTLYQNPGRWTGFANMVFTESPAGAGYSYADTPAGYLHNDSSVAVDNFNAVLQFLEKYPVFKTRDIYIAGESYAGIYVPTLAKQILQSNSKIALKGIMVGNGCTGTDTGGCSKNAEQTDIDFLTDRALISPKSSEAVNKVCKDDWSSNDCANAIAEATDTVGAVDVYNIYFPCVSNSDSDTLHALTDVDHPNFPWRAPPSTVAKAVARNQINQFKIKNKQLKNSVGTKPSGCFVDNDPLTIYLNKPEVKAAAHIPAAVVGEWRVCGPRPGSSYKWDYTNTQRDETKDVYPLIVDSSVRVLIFNGDVDLCVPYNGNQKWTSEFGEALGVKEEWRPWLVDDQVAGYVTSYAKNFTFATVKDAGHMVPQFQPVNGQALAKRFLSGLPL